MRRVNDRGQNLAEYAILIGLVITAFLTIQVYARRGLQARVKSGTDALTSVFADIQSKNDGTLQASFKSQSQYEPYYAESGARTYQENVKQQHLGDGKVVEEIVSDVSARAVGAFQRQKGASNRATVEPMWESPGDQ